MNKILFFLSWDEAKVELQFSKRRAESGTSTMIKGVNFWELQAGRTTGATAKKETVQDNNFRVVSETDVEARMWFPPPSLHFNTQRAA